MNAKAIYLFFPGLIFPVFSLLWAQSPEDSLYRQLESAQLVVRLPSQEKKINALQTTIADTTLAETSRARLRAQLEKVRKETRDQNHLIVRAFQSYFGALPVSFVYDTTHHPKQAALLNDKLEVMEGREVDGPILQLRFGRPVQYSGSGAESMVLTDSRLRDLGPPFPKPVIMTGIGYGFNKIIAPETAFERLLEKRVQKLDRKLRQLLQ